VATPTPSLTTVVDAVAAQINTITNIGTVLAFEHTVDDEQSKEFVVKYRNVTTGVLDLWLVEVLDVLEIQGLSSGEFYELYHIQVRYLCVRIGASDWFKQARNQLELVRDKLAKNTAVFRIGGQPQLRTEETVSLGTFGRTPSVNGKPLIQGVLKLTVEARRWT